MIKVGVIGLGMMGGTHLDVYAKRDDVQVVAISDLNPDRLSGKAKAAGNIEGQAQGGFDYDAVEKYPEGKDLIKKADVDLIDICLPTPLHVPFAQKAIAAGRHVLTEKPMGRTHKDALKLVEAAKKTKKAVMVAMCMRFWPGWDWLKQAIDNKTYGKVKAAVFQRVSAHPGGPFYLDGDQCGGALLDLHVHDTDFIKWCFGTPKSVTSYGYSKISGEIDHLVTNYEYDKVPLVIAEGCWCNQDGFPFSMGYRVNFENATAVFNMAAEHPLTLYQAGEVTPVEISPAMGYELEIAYLLSCIKDGVKPKTVTLKDAAESIRIADAERKSIKTGKKVSLKK